MHTPRWMRGSRWLLTLALLACSGLTHAQDASSAGAPGHAPTLEELQAAARAPMTFTEAPDLCASPMPCRHAVYAHGVILDDTPVAFAAYVQDHHDRPPQVLLMDSLGGAFLRSLELGTLIRSHGLDTYVGPAHDCESGCVWAMMGGVHRQIDSRTSLWVHTSRLKRTGPAAELPPNLKSSDLDLLVAWGYREALQEMGLAIQYLDAMNIRPETINATFLSFDQTKPISSLCARQLGLDNVSSVRNDELSDQCGNPKAIPMPTTAIGSDRLLQLVQQQIRSLMAH